MDSRGNTAWDAAGNDEEDDDDEDDSGPRECDRFGGSNVVSIVAHSVADSIRLNVGFALR